MDVNMLNREKLPKTIWFSWMQGLDNAPLVVQKCYESWIAHNPEWNVVFIDENNIHEYIPSQHGQVSRQVFSDIIRINLLAVYGGVWVDATCFCVKALDSWIYDYMASGFFAFERPGFDRMLSSWFIACHKNNYITEAFQKAVNVYWEKNYKLAFVENSKWRMINRYQRLFSTQLWFSNFATKILKIYPYFWFHYLFERIYLSDRTVRKMWDMMPKISADIPHSLQLKGLFSTLSDEIKEEITSMASPCYKLTWKYDSSAFREGTVMSYLLKEKNMLSVEKRP